jgi:hypothetical protein
MWLTRYEGARTSTMETVAMHDARFANSLELAVRFGKVSPDPLMHLNPSTEIWIRVQNLNVSMHKGSRV